MPLVKPRGRKFLKTKAVPDVICSQTCVKRLPMGNGGDGREEMEKR